jgi:YfiH family protein
VTPLFRTPAVFQSFPELLAAESTRHGGVSEVPYQSLNLGRSTGDDPDRVAENRRRFYAAVGIAESQVASSHQVHGEEIRVTHEPGRWEGHDAIVTAQPGVFALVTVADCTPVLVYDTRNRVVAAIHAGWRGTVAELVRKTLERMRDEWGTAGADCRAYVGTCIDACSFEVGADVADHVAGPFKRFDAAKQKFFVDLKAANAAQLRAFGVPEEQVQLSRYSTVLHNRDYFSHRLERGTTGRMVALIGLR